MSLNCPLQCMTSLQTWFWVCNRCIPYLRMRMPFSTPCSVRYWLQQEWLQQDWGLWESLNYIQDLVNCWIAENKDLCFLNVISHPVSIELVYLYVVLEYWWKTKEKTSHSFSRWLACHQKSLNDFQLRSRTEFPAIAGMALNIHLPFLCYIIMWSDILSFDN